MLLHLLVLFSSGQSFDRLCWRRHIRDNSAKILFQTFLQEAIASSSAMDGGVYSLMLFIQHFLRQPPHCQPSKSKHIMSIQKWVCYALLVSACFLYSTGPVTKQSHFKMKTTVHTHKRQLCTNNAKTFCNIWLGCCSFHSACCCLLSWFSNSYNVESVCVANFL